MTPEKAMSFAREDIAELRHALTRSECHTLHAAIIGYCRALLDCGLISAAQRTVLIAEAGLEIANWHEPTVAPAQLSD
jgi:hypothetical protein